MTEVQDATDRAAQPISCPQCGKAEHVQKMSAIPDLPAEFRPSDEPDSTDPYGVVLILLGLASIPVLGVPIGAVMYLMVGRYEGMILALGIGGSIILSGVERLRSKRREKEQWEEAMSRWKRLYFCPRDEVTFIPGETSTCTLHEVRDLLYADQEEWAGLALKPTRFTDKAPKPTLFTARAPKPTIFTDFSPMPEEFADFARMLEEAKEKNRTLVCFECGHHNPVGQTPCEECGAWVRQTARGRWAHSKYK